MILLIAALLMLLRVFYSAAEMYFERDLPRCTWRGLLLSMAIFGLCCSVFGQEVRVDIPVQTSGPIVPVTGGPLPQALWVANAKVALCTHPQASLSACQANPLPTFTDSTGAISCNASTPLVQLPGTTCTASPGTTANIGFWYAGGLFDYYVTSSYGTYGPFTGNLGVTGTPIAPSSVNVNVPGIWTNTQANEYLYSTLNGCNPGTEFQATQNSNFMTEGISGCVAVPSAATSWQQNGIAGYAVTSAGPSNPSLGPNAVSVYGQARGLVTNAHIWGLNIVTQDLVGTSQRMVGFEDDINVAGTPTYVSGFQITGNGTGTLPPGASAIEVEKIASNSWGEAIATDDGAAGTGLVLGAQGLTANSNSQLIVFTNRDSGNTPHQASFFVDPAGVLHYNPAAAQSTAGFDTNNILLTGAPTGSVAMADGTGAKFTSTSVLFKQLNPSTPVLGKGGSYGGWTANAFAAPGFTSDGTQFVLTVSLWSVANSKWATAFFTSPLTGSNALTQWTYVTNSLQTPQGSDYIIGNGDVKHWGSQYYWTYDHYPSGSLGSTPLSIATSSNLTSWSVLSGGTTPSGAYVDPALAINPNGNLELYAMDSSRAGVWLWTTTNGTSWSGPTEIFTFPSYCSFCGEPSVFYIGTARYLTFDNSPSPLATNARFTQMVVSPAQNTTWYNLGDVNLPQSAYSWQSVEVFDAAEIVADTGDGLGNIPRMLFAGGDNNSTTDNTDSSIGYAIKQSLSDATFSGLGCYPVTFSVGSNIYGADTSFCWNPATQTLTPSAGSIAPYFTVAIGGTNEGTLSSGGAQTATLAGNAYYSSPNWNLINTAAPATFIACQGVTTLLGNNCTFYGAPAGTSPITSFDPLAEISHLGAWFPKPVAIVQGASVVPTSWSWTDAFNVLPSGAGGMTIITTGTNAPYITFKTGTPATSGLIGSTGAVNQFFVSGAVGDMVIRANSGKNVAIGPDNGSGTATPTLYVTSTGLNVVLPTSAGSGGLFVCIDINGVMYKKATCP